MRNAMNPFFVILVIATTFLIPFGSWSKNYIEQDCNDIFPSLLYPELNSFCMYLIGEDLSLVEGGKGYSHLFMKDKDGYGLYRNFTKPGYPQFYFNEMLLDYSFPLMNAYDQSNRSDFDTWMRRLVWNFKDGHMKYSAPAGAGIDFDAEYVWEQDEYGNMKVDENGDAV